MNDNGLNLARKWRSKHLDEIIGQKLVIRTIKNSLYRNLIFPVYLFSGTRGCGKTSTARLFAAALNCEHLEAFRKNPQKIVLPCLTCTSCSAMQATQHPDFIEIDAASHTGVDNVRQIIDAASFVPVLGGKKIYLIDEAHMLSKAAFNALLKVLEEPPQTALFMLATTDPHKIIDTVRSRCFQLFFHPLASADLIAHLGFICQQEKIVYDKSALEVIAHISEGSARDALNVIERVRLLHTSLTKQTVLDALGCIDDEHLLLVFKAVLEGNQTQVLRLIQQLHLERYNTLIVWRKYVELLRVALWIKQGVEFGSDLLKRELPSLVSYCSLDTLLRMLEVCYEYELTLAKTSTPHTIFELVLLKMCGLQSQAYKKEPPSLKQNSPVSEPLKEKITSEWDMFLKEVEKLDDPLVVSIFKQGIFSKVDNQQVEVSFSQDLAFFEEWLKTTQTLWQPLLERCFKTTVMLKAQFTGPLLPVTSKTPAPPPVSQPPVQQPMMRQVAPSKSFTSSKPRFIKKEEPVLSLDKEKWPRASTLVRIFPGTIVIKAKES
jgi:DNA polymerase III subunit gamma/tau